MAADFGRRGIDTQQSTGQPERRAIVEFDFEDARALM